MSGSQQATTTSNSAPWAGQQPYLQQGFQSAQNLYNSSTPQYYPGQTVANQSPATQSALAGTIARATNGSPLNNTASSYLQSVMSPSYMNAGSPNSGAVFNNVASQVLPAVNSQFSLAGRYGSGAQANAASEGLTNAYAPFAMNLFQGQEANQQQAAGMAPNQANQAYTDLGQLGQAGATQDAYGQSLINANVNKFNWGQQLPANKLAQYMQMVQGNYGGTGTSTQTQPNNMIPAAIGGILGSIL